MAKAAQDLTKNWPASKVELWPLAKIIPYFKNPRLHSPEQIDLIAASMIEDGVTAPILVDEEGIIIYGHGRRLGAEKNNFPVYPVVVARGWSDAKKRAYRIKDNRFAELSTWSQELLSMELRDLSAGGYNMPLLGFDDISLVSFLSVPGTSDPEDIPDAPKKSVVRPGDLWTLGSHQLLCGDSTSKEAVERVLPAAARAVMVSDPPYGIDYEYETHQDKKATNSDLVRAVFENAPEAKIWTPGKMNLARELAIYPDAKVLIWHKKFAAAGNGLGGASTIEPVLVIGIKNGRLPDDYMAFSTDREVSPISPEKMLRDEHPCPKPVSLFEHLIGTLTNPKDLIFEPFNGSGTTLIAAHVARRRFAGVEIDPIYVELAILRWEKFSGEKATLDGKTLDQVRTTRTKKRRA